MFKDEACGIQITEFVGLCSKMYSFTNDNQEVKKTAKGTNKNTIDNELTLDDYKNTLFNNGRIYKTQRRIGSESHNVVSSETNRASLSCVDDKRFILNDGITSLAYGHFRIKQLQQQQK